MADIYLAVARGALGFSKLVVLKHLRNDDEDRRSLDMFLDEARLAPRLSHPNIVDTYDVGQDGDSYFIAMEYLEGQSLSRILRGAQGTRISPTVWARIVADALRGLHYAHELCDYDGAPLGIVHRDVSPPNIFITYTGETKIVDFGIAKAKLNTFQTEAGVFKGKLGYMAPEQAVGPNGLADKQNVRADHEAEHNVHEVFGSGKASLIAAAYCLFPYIRPGDEDIRAIENDQQQERAAVEAQVRDDQKLQPVDNVPNKMPELLAMALGSRV